jgi:signal transduction histidine kinase
MSGRQSPLVIDAHRIRLTEGLHAPARARAWIAEQVGGQPAALVDDALLVTSELVTNAVRYGEPEVFLGLTYIRDGIRIEVSDAGSAMPTMINPSAEHDGLGRAHQYPLTLIWPV